MDFDPTKIQIALDTSNFAPRLSRPDRHPDYPDNAKNPSNLVVMPNSSNMTFHFPYLGGLAKSPFTPIAISAEVTIPPSAFKNPADFLDGTVGYMQFASVSDARGLFCGRSSDQGEIVVRTQDQYGHKILIDPRGMGRDDNAKLVWAPWYQIPNPTPKAAQSPAGFSAPFKLDLWSDGPAHMITRAITNKITQHTNYLREWVYCFNGITCIVFEKNGARTVLSAIEWSSFWKATYNWTNYTINNATPVSESSRAEASPVLPSWTFGGAPVQTLVDKATANDPIFNNDDHIGDALDEGSPVQDHRATTVELNNFWSETSR